MASSSGLFSPDHFLCSICLGVFVQPVSTPCGHNFCLSCIASYWDTTVHQCCCPICKHRFHHRPDLKVNTFISGLAEQLTLLQVTDVPTWSSDQQQQQKKVRSGNTVMCDICTDDQREAVRSCFQCLSSYCQIHLEPHERVPGLKRHTLVQPLTDLEDRICKEHSKVLMFFCRDEEILLCSTCADSHTPTHHHVTPIEEAFTSMKVQLGNEEVKVQELICEREQKVSKVQELLKRHTKETEDVKAKCTQDLMELVQKIQKNQEELVRVMEEKKKAAEKEAADVLNRMEQEMTELQETAQKLRELKQTQDQLVFLQKFSSVRPLGLCTVDLSTMRCNSHEKMQQIRTSLSRTVSQLQTCVDDMDADVNMFSDGGGASSRTTLRYAQQYEVDFVLDPDTAHPFLSLSDDRKQVRYTGVKVDPTSNLDQFTEHLAVLSVRGFVSCKFYFEAFVGSKTEWCLGVAAASVQRRGPILPGSGCGLWALWFLEDKFESFSAPNRPVQWGKVDRVGVFVDYNGGQVSFWDVRRTTVLYSFRGCVFTEELYPYFNPCDNEYGSNLDPIVLVPVSRPH
ncbi:E3 ubiquitin-protein ligase TRIM39-like [Sphaeramia orbicularis]|uniref:E3 ubiquitin-protein ligase TRIM39-like n=1 Tax=Sphaeramia orbicularis TaxID=375764 RepID=UPI00117C0A3A|nr:E3 ubiquitin-protein ligase TRIM39-like [Sphaeramia orbicularis]